MSSVDAYVCSFGKSNLSDRLSIVTDLWNSSISADYALQNENSPESIINHCKNLGINWLVILKEKTSRGIMLKIKGINKKYETEVQRNELCDTLNYQLNEVSKIKHNSLSNSEQKSEILSLRTKSSLEFSSQANFQLNVTLLSSRKIPMKTIIDKANKEFEKFHNFATTMKPIEIFVCDLPKDTVQRIMEHEVLNDDVIKKCKQFYCNGCSGAVDYR